VPFGFLKRKHPEQAQAGQPGTGSSAPAQGIERGGGVRSNAGHMDATHLHVGAARGVPFTALTEDWRLRGRMEITGRLSDALNRREAIAMTDVTWGSPEESSLEPAPGLKSVDPYDLILVTAGEDSLPPLTETERAALKVHKVAYDVALEVPPFRVVGTVFMHPGAEPEGLLARSTEMFLPVTDARATLGEIEVSEPEVDVILVNRFYLRGVEQVDKTTGQAHVRLPGLESGA
jgi:hypothetical protein